jgi:hypothetical protein
MKPFRSAACLAMTGCLAIPAAAQFKNGVEVRILTRDGHSIRGELLVVRRDAFVIAVADSDREMTLDHASIRTLETARKTSPVRSGLFGLLIGGALGAATGPPSSVDPQKTPNVSPVTRRTAVGAGLGFLAGAGLALWAGRTETYDFTSIRPAARMTLLEKLRKGSRYPGVI